MENDQIFAADAILDQSSGTSRSRLKGHQGQDITKAALGAIEPQKLMDYEDTPLLSRDYDRNSSAGRLTPSESGDRPPLAWSGERDHEGKPWWNTPSVRVT